jgi:hypothetical protein
MCPRLCENSEVKLSRRIFVSDTLNWKRTALAGTVKIRKERTQFCSLSTRAGFHTAWTRRGSHHKSLKALLHCRRQIEKSPLAQIEMSLSTVLVGEFWADDGDCDEPDGDRPDERVARSGCEQDQSGRSRGTDEPWSASGVPTGQGLQPARPRGPGIPPPRPAEQPLLPFGFAHCSHRHHPGALPGLRPNAGGREACRTS